VKVTRKVILKRRPRPRLKYLAEKLEQCDREKAFLARIPCELERARLPKPEGLVPKKLLPHFTKDQLETLAETAVIDKMIPQPEPAAPSDFEFWRAYRERCILEEETNRRNLRPLDTLEKMLTTQMAAVHRRAMNFISTEGRGEEVALHSAIRLLRLFTLQVEALKSWRTKSTQTVRVEHIAVNSGGQAIVGNVTALPRG
jgi:hypothetical protein